MDRHADRPDYLHVRSLHGAGRPAASAAPPPPCYRRKAQQVQQKEAAHAGPGCQLFRDLVLLLLQLPINSKPLHNPCCKVMPGNVPTRNVTPANTRTDSRPPRPHARELPPTTLCSSSSPLLQEGSATKGQPASLQMQVQAVCGLAGLFYCCGSTYRAHSLPCTACCLG